MTNYLAKFVPDYSEATAPLRELLRQDVDWCWLELHTAAFTKLKELITGPPVLRYFDVHKPVVLSADASKHGLGAVCLQNDRWLSLQGPSKRLSHATLRLRKSSWPLSMLAQNSITTYMDGL